MPRESRPFGVTVIVLVSLLSVAVTLIAAADDTLLSLPDVLIASLGAYTQLTPFEVVNVLLVPLEVFLLFALWHLKQWAWLLYMLTLGFSMVVHLQAHFAGTDPNYVLMMLHVVNVFYLNQRDVQRAFGYDEHRTEDEVMV